MDKISILVIGIKKEKPGFSIRISPGSFPNQEKFIGVNSNNTPIPKNNMPRKMNILPIIS